LCSTSGAGQGDEEATRIRTCQRILQSCVFIDFAVHGGLELAGVGVIEITLFLGIVLPLVSKRLDSLERFSVGNENILSNL
jgi:hypothetical protein